MLQPSPNANNLRQSIHIAANDRCRHSTPTGRRCRLHADASSGFCAKHYDEHVAEIASTLTRDLDDLSSAEQVSTFLSRLLLLLAQDKISARRAAVLTYIASQLLRSVHTMIAEEKHGPGTEIVFDAPRPDHSNWNAAKRDAAESKSDAAPRRNSRSSSNDLSR